MYKVVSFNKKRILVVTIVNCVEAMFHVDLKDHALF